MRYSLNVQATVNHLGFFTSYYIGWPGSCHDRRIFNESIIPQQHKTLIHDDYIIGDDGYKPCTPYLICPYPKPKPSEDRQRIFNKKLSKTRVVVEHAFGRLKSLLLLFFHINQ
ncbi:harbinger transposase-derived nuclease domain-containing protein [Jimgerdemannia flammicorona]|uniref:Harbinger transposase-derived nuclease domain-containing protein n=1 Tax=Jimgerdemannia flammicorona TaxID=994334 RepID=A0A433QME1_9FUNG|nr:harbinger transposase-derived nuclease domain-containing protein [Jimgerdemannia flammicorona]